MRKNRMRTFSLSSLPILVLLAGLSALGNADSRASGSNGSQSFSQTWRLMQPVTYENMTVFPIVAAENADTGAFVTLDDALASGDVVITEQGSYLRRTRDRARQVPYGAGPEVNQLVLVNRGKRPLILLAGEVISGGKQDRIIGKDRIIPVGAAPLPLDVFCVEHGRWTGDSEKFSAAQLMVHPAVRKEAAIEQDQGKVWAAVRGEMAPGANSSDAGIGVAGGGIGGAQPNAAPPPISPRRLDSTIASEAPTQAYTKIYKSSPIGTSVESFAEEMQRRFQRATEKMKGEHVVGVVIAYGGEVAWSDIFASSQLFDAYWPKLLRSYAVEALTRPEIRQVASLDDARDFLRPLTGHVREESDPGVYRWIEQDGGHIASIELEALEPKPITLHWLKVAEE
ncbi:MAG TPA: DUF6569 family protein [Candidatus Acidoferrum sp.]